MNRTTLLVSILVAALVVVLWWFFLMAPKGEEIAELEAQVDQTLAQQATLRNQIASLESVRAEAPAIEADLAAAEAVIPRSASLPSAIRQLAQAADDSGVTLLSVVPGRPVAVAVAAEAAPGLASLNVAVGVEGSYFQLVDFLRRVEDPAITPRALLWESLSVAIGDQPYPILNASLSGQMYSILPAVPGTAAPEPDPTETPTELETEVAP